MIRSGFLRFFVARALVALLVVQVAAAGFCLLAPEAHAMPEAEAASVSALSGFPCADEDAAGNVSGGGDASACVHCGQPDLASLSVPDFSAATEWLPLFRAHAFAEMSDSRSGVRLHALPLVDDPGGSAGERALLFHLIPRIRV